MVECFENKNETHRLGEGEDKKRERKGSLLFIRIKHGSNFVWGRVSILN
jgi:hypothetical protein